MQKITTNKPLPHAVVTQMLSLATSGLGLVSALAWNEVVKTTVDTYIKPYVSAGSGLISLIIYAIIITALAVTVTYHLARLQQTLTAKTIDKPRTQQ